MGWMLVVRWEGDGMGRRGFLYTFSTSFTNLDHAGLRGSSRLSSPRRVSTLGPNFSLMRRRPCFGDRQPASCFVC